MKLTVIGCYGAYPDANGATSGYLVEDGETKILLDCGSGVLAKLQNYIPLSKLDAVVITHYHPDHCADFGCMQYAAMIEKQLGKRRKPLSAWGPEDPETLSYGDDCAGRCYEQGLPFQIGSLQFSVTKNDHEIASYAVRVTSSGGARLVYSGDTAYYGGLAGFAENADCFLCEASFYIESRNRRKAKHLTSSEAAKLADAARAKRLILTHLLHFGEPERLAAEARAVYAGDVLLAKSGLSITI